MLFNKKVKAAGAIVASSALVLGAVGLGTTAANAATTITVATVNNGNMKDMEGLKGEFEKANPGITVKFQVLEEGDLRAKVTTDIATGGGAYDVITIGAYEVPMWGADGKLVDLTADLADPAYDVKDILPPVRSALSVKGKQYAVPFYGESSILMYNKDMLKAKGLTMPKRPTWQQVATIAKKLKTSSVNGICMRGKPGWGDLFAPLTTVVQTFGGAWYDMKWNAQVNAKPFVEAVTFYKKLLDESGEKDPVSYSFNECLTSLKNKKSAMWVDASVAASMLEATDSPVKGKMGYVHAPVYKTKESGWLWSWNLAVPKSTKQKDAAVKFVKWATSKEYHQLVGKTLGWASVPPGARTSTYAIPEYKAAAKAFAAITLEVMSAVNPAKPGLNPQPWTGIQFVAIPEFQDVGNKVAQLVADALAGRKTIKAALDAGQKIAQAAGNKHK